MSLVASTLIELRPTRRGDQRAFIAGTRISVLDVYVAHELAGQTPDEIVAAYPHLSLAQVHGALLYCFEHLAEIRRQLQSDKDFVERMKACSGPGPFAQKLDRANGHGSPVSPG